MRPASPAREERAGSKRGSSFSEHAAEERTNVGSRVAGAKLRDRWRARVPLAPRAPVDGRRLLAADVRSLTRARATASKPPARSVARTWMEAPEVVARALHAADNAAAGRHPPRVRRSLCGARRATVEARGTPSSVAATRIDLAARQGGRRRRASRPALPGESEIRSRAPNGFRVLVFSVSVAEVGYGASCPIEARPRGRSSDGLSAARRSTLDRVDSIALGEPVPGNPREFTFAAERLPSQRCVGPSRPKALRQSIRPV